MSRLRYLAWLAPVLAAGLMGGCGSDGGNTKGDGGVDASHTDGGATCGNAVTEGTEECDDGNSTPDDGCENDCTYTCSNDADCDDGSTCNGTETCSTSLHVCQAGTMAPDGTNCEIVLGLGADGGVTDGGAETVLGRCISGQCGAPCTMNDQCDDANPCNGDETCDMMYGSCAPGTPLDCDDGEACTNDSCDPEAPGGCVHELTKDIDGDGFVDESMTCDDPSLGGDCNDDDPTIHPGAQELCDGKDNDCDGSIETSAQMPTWYEDCDGDGLAPKSADQIHEPVVSCTKPATTSQCIDWTTTTPSAAQYQDCDDTNKGVHPGATNTARSDGNFTKPYCRGGGNPGGADITFASGSYGSYSCTGSSYSWDFDCNGTWDKFDGVTTDYSCGFIACGGGWAGSSVPQCGQSASYQTCGAKSCTQSCGMFGCTLFCSCPNGPVVTQQQTCR